MCERTSSDAHSAARTRAEWERAYESAMQWRDWETCDQLLEERERAVWYVKRDMRRRWLIASWRNLTVYMDIRVPFTDRVFVLDVGRHSAFGWRYAR